MPPRIGETEVEYEIRMAAHRAGRGPSKKKKARDFEERGRYDAMSPESIYEALCKAAEDSGENNVYGRYIARMALSYIHRIEV